MNTLTVPWQLYSNVVIAGMFVLVFCQYWDEKWGKPLDEQVRVQERRFVASHVRITGRTYSVAPEAWSIHVANDQGGSWVQVTEKFYRSIQEGDKLFITGKRGRWSRRWYIQDISKKPH